MTEAESLPLSARCAFREGGHARNWALFIIAGSEREKSGKATQMPTFADLALCSHAVRGDPPQGRRSLPKRLMLMKTARFPAGWDACGVGRESLIQGRCVPNGRFSHLYHGGDIRPLRAEYSEPSKGRGEEVASHLSAPRAAISARGSRGQRLPQVSPRACGTTPTSPFF